jgi:hypothetical protein
VPSPQAPLPFSVLVPLGWQTPASQCGGQSVLAADPYKLDNAQLTAALKERFLSAQEEMPDPARKFFRSETGQVTIDGPRDSLLLDTPRTAGGYAPAGRTLDAARSGVRISMEGSDATVWVSALDSNPILKSARLLVTHLTDLQNTSVRYAEPARQTLLEWGRLPYLVREGRAEVVIRLETPSSYRVWALSPGGKRLAEVPARTEAGALHFTADVAGDAAGGARMLYEVAVK